MVQVAILVAIAVTLGIIFKDQISNFVNNTFDSLNTTDFQVRFMNIVEATIVLPLTILICFSMIFIMLGYYNDLIEQIEYHQEAIIELYD